MDAREILLNQVIRGEKLKKARELRAHMTAGEQAFWNMVRNKRLAGLKFRRQQIIEGFIADFYCPTLNIVVEIDGSSHDDRKEDDRERDRIFKANGIKVLRLTNQEVLRIPDTVHQKVIKFLPAKI